VLITATQSDLAQLARILRESASRFLAVLERAGIITQGAEADRSRRWGAGALRLLAIEQTSRPGRSCSR